MSIRKQWGNLFTTALVAVALCFLHVGNIAKATQNSKLPTGVNHLKAHQGPHAATGAGINVGVLELGSSMGMTRGIRTASSNMGARLMTQYDFSTLDPDAIAPFPTINPATTAGSTHTELVANTLAGGTTAGFVGVAPGANIFFGGIGTDTTTSAQDFDSYRLATKTMLNTHGVYLYNVSFDLDVPNNGPANGQDLPSLYSDWFQTKYDALIVQAAGNNGTGFGDLTTEIVSNGVMFNGIVVGNANGTGRATSSSWHVVGDTGASPDLRGLPHILAVGTSIGDSHTNSSGTSFAAPHVAGAAALLMENGLGLPGPATRNRLAIKSLLLNSARKRNIITPENAQQVSGDNGASSAEASDGDYLMGNMLRVGSTTTAPKTGNWTPTQWSYNGTVFHTDRPLDDEQGTGLLDAERALINMDGGEQNGMVSPIGWDRDAVISNGSNDYSLNFNIMTGNWLTATLTWDRIVAESDNDGIIEDSDTYAFSSLADLDLELYFQNTLVAHSAGIGGTLGENVEHLHIPLMNDADPNDYVISINNRGGGLINYGLAWWVGSSTPIPEPTAILLVGVGLTFFAVRRRFSV